MPTPPHVTPDMAVKDVDDTIFSLLMELSSNTQNLEVKNTVQPSDSYPSVGLSTTDHLSSFHLTTPSHSFFQNARNFEVKDAQFNTNANVTINHNTTTNDTVTTILWPHVVAGAIFNSAARYAAGKCHPGTRKKIIERIVAWIEDPDPTQPILWMYGPAGAGKSAIAHTICELIQESHPDNEGGSFFFSSGTPDRGNALKLFATLAYQLAIQFPSIRTEINNVLSRDPSLPTKSMEIQLFHLIIQPLKQCQMQLLHSPVLIIDGLDECADEEGLDTQRKIVALLAKSVVDHTIPLRFMVASRPEYWIREAFDTVPLPTITLPISLQDDVDTAQDIKIYLMDGFEQIRVDNKRIMGSVVSPWPSAKIVDHFVYEASGQYIYAATLLKFVGRFSKFSNAQKQLDILTSLGPHRALAFSELDRLYATILATYPQWEAMKRVLAALLLGANTTIITVILGVNSDELVLVLDALSSLIDIQKRRLFSEDQTPLESAFDSESLQDVPDRMSFCHRSFREFLQDETRSGAFYIDLNSDAVTHEIVNGFFSIIHQNLDQYYEMEPYIYCNIDYTTYHRVLSLVASASIRHSTILFLLPLITHLTAKLKRFDPIKFTRMHSIFYFLRDMVNLHSAILRPAFGNELFEQRSNEGQPELLTQFQSTCQNLDQAVILACGGAQSGLVSCTDFETTPSFVYLTEFWHCDFTLPLDGLRSIAGITDAVSTLKQYRYIFHMWYNTRKESWIPTGTPFFWLEPGPDWRDQGAWRDLRILFASRLLNSILRHPRARLEGDEYVSRLLVLRRFFNSREISDIANEEYFHDTSNLDILSAITDVESWIDLLDDLRLPPYFLVSMLSWINGQLTNPQTVTLLQNYDKTLQQRMVTVMNCIFERGFLKQLRKFDRDELCAYAPGYRTNSDPRSTTIKVWPLPGGFREEEMDSNSAYEHWDPNDSQSFHDELFEETVDPESINAPIDPIIHPSRWHPHLVAKLLKLLVRFLYGQIHPEFSTEGYNYEQSFSYITECLPYAHPTQINLDALRALVYLYPQVSPTWNPPEGLWSSLVDFLQKYDRSILSSEELRLFVVWLNSTKHEDISTYIDD